MPPVARVEQFELVSGEESARPAWGRFAFRRTARSSRRGDGHVPGSATGLRYAKVATACVGVLLVYWFGIILPLQRFGVKLWPIDGRFPEAHILLLEADQARPDAHGIVALQQGRLAAITPNLDGIAADGVRFTRAYSSTPICTPARLALLTGRSPFRHGMRSYQPHVPPPFEGRMELVQTLEALSYYTAVVGKNHYGVVGGEAAQAEGRPFEMHGFIESHLYEGLLEYDSRSSAFVRLDDYGEFFRKNCHECDPLDEGPVLSVRDDGTVAGSGETPRRAAWRDVPGATPFNSAKGYAWPHAEYLHPTAWTSATAVSVFARWNAIRDDTPKVSKPLFLKVSFHRPHSPYDPPERWLRRILERWDGIAAPAAGTWDAPATAAAECTARERRYCGASCGYQSYCGALPEHDARLVRAHYYASLSFVDEQAGLLLSAMRQAKNVWANTFVLYTSDHGDALGDHGLWRKGWPYEQVATVPFYVRWPNAFDGYLRVRRGSELQHLVELRDVFPTLASVAGVVDLPTAANSSSNPSEDAPDGRSLLPLLQGNQTAVATWRDTLLLELAMCNFNGTNWAALTDGRHKYVRHLNDGREQLFDLSRDPYEMRDLAADEPSTLAEWRARLYDRFAREGRGSKWSPTSTARCEEFEDLSRREQPAQALGAGEGRDAPAAARSTASVGKAPDGLPSGAATRPNIVLFLSDDQDLLLGGMQPMRRANALLAAEGAVFTNAFAHTPICGPSRAQLLTGRYLHNLKIDPTLPKPRPADENCMHVNTSLVTDHTFAKPLKAAGYTVGLFGKYLNWPADWKRHVPAGFDAWFANGGGDYLSPRFTARNLASLGYEDGEWQGTPSDYSTSVIGNVSVAWLEAVAPRPQPFFAYVAVKAAHEPYTPAPWYADHWEPEWPEREPRPPNWNCSSAERSKHHGVIATAPMLDGAAEAVITASFKNRWRTLLSFDDLIAAAHNAVKAAGALERTYFVLTSDHGFQLGQFNIPMDKRHVYDWDTRVPLVVSGPGIAPGGWQVSKPATLVDLAPTFLSLAGIAKPAAMDGRSLLPLLIDETDRSALAALRPATRAHVEQTDARRARSSWRSAVLLAHFFFTENVKCIGGCSACDDCRAHDSNCGDTLAGQTCWSTLGATWYQTPDACTGQCYPTESLANNFVALRHVGGQPGAANSEDTLYAEFQHGNLDIAPVDFSAPSHYEFFDVGAGDFWQMNNLYYDAQGQRATAERGETLDKLHELLRRWLSCAGDACP